MGIITKEFFKFKKKEIIFCNLKQSKWVFPLTYDWMNEFKITLMFVKKEIIKKNVKYENLNYLRQW